MKNLILVTLSAVILTGCGSLGAKYDADRASKVKRVAILGMEIHQDQPTDNLGVGKLGQISEGAPRDQPEIKKMAEEVYEQAVSSLKTKTGWSFMSIDALRNSPTYKEIYVQKMEGGRFTSMSNGRAEIIFADGVLDGHNFRQLKPEQKRELARKLGADAYAELQIFQQMDQSWMSIGHLSGNAAFELTSRANLTVYDLTSDDPVWRVQNVDGDPSANSSTLPKQMSKYAKLGKLGRDSSVSALGKLADKYPGKN